MLSCFYIHKSSVHLKSTLCTVFKYIPAYEIFISTLGHALSSVNRGTRLGSANPSSNSSSEPYPPAKQQKHTTLSSYIGFMSVKLAPSPVEIVSDLVSNIRYQKVSFVLQILKKYNGCGLRIMHYQSQNWCWHGWQALANQHPFNNGTWRSITPIVDWRFAG